MSFVLRWIKLALTGCAMFFGFASMSGLILELGKLDQIIIGGAAMIITLIFTIISEKISARIA